MQSTDESSGSKKRKLHPERLEYLDQLVVEFQTTKSKDAREQVLANLANFAFDPFNYEFFRQLNVFDLFLDTLCSKEENLVKFSIGGLCNSCLDPINKQYIVKNGLERIINLLNHSNEDILLSTITTLMFVITPGPKQGLRYKRQGSGIGSSDKNLSIGLPSIDQQKVVCSHGAALLDDLAEIFSTEVIRVIFKQSQNKNCRLSNLAKIFLQDCCTEEQIKQVSAEVELATIPILES